MNKQMNQRDCIEQSSNSTIRFKAYFHNNVKADKFSLMQKNYHCTFIGRNTCSVMISGCEI